MGKKKAPIQYPSYRINREIHTLTSTVRLVCPDGTSTVCHINEARERAKELELDLIEINPKSDPPVLRIADYGKFLYEVKKKTRQQAHSTKPLKEIQLSVQIAENDMKTKAEQAKRFISDGSKVKVILSMKGREKNRREENKATIYEFVTMLEKVAVPESMPKDEGDSKTIVILRRK